MMIDNQEQLESKENKQYRGFKQIVNTFYNEEIELMQEEKVKIKMPIAELLRLNLTMEMKF